MSRSLHEFFFQFTHTKFGLSPLAISEFLKQNFIDVMLQMGEMQQVSLISSFCYDG